MLHTILPDLKTNKIVVDSVGSLFASNENGNHHHHIVHNCSAKNGA